MSDDEREAALHDLKLRCPGLLAPGIFVRDPYRASPLDELKRDNAKLRGEVKRLRRALIIVSTAAILSGAIHMLALLVHK